MIPWEWNQLNPDYKEIPKDKLLGFRNKQAARKKKDEGKTYGLRKT